MEQHKKNGRGNRKRHRKEGFEILNDGIKVEWTPGEEDTSKCIEFGENLM